jgi:hypothetical protein
MSTVIRDGMKHPRWKGRLAIEADDMLDNRARWEQIWTTTVLKPQ